MQVIQFHWKIADGVFNIITGVGFTALLLAVNVPKHLNGEQLPREFPYT